MKWSASFHVCLGLSMRLIVGSMATGDLSMAEASEAAAISVVERETELEVRFKDRRVLLYVFSPSQFKPYVKELYTLTGGNVLLDAPADHLHHHGLMYAVRVNGVNFWEEAAQSGRQRAVGRVVSHTGLNRSGEPQAQFRQNIDWLEPIADASSPDRYRVLLREVRLITLTIAEPDGEVAVDWLGQFEPGPGIARVQITGSGYNGLGLRLPPEFNLVARHANSEGLPYTSEGKWDVTKAKWGAVTGPAQTGEVSVALFGFPSNAGETRFFSMRNPFTYLSVTQNLEEHPLEYASGARFEVRYRIGVYSRALTAEELNRRCGRWLQSIQPNEK